MSCCDRLHCGLNHHTKGIATTWVGHLDKTQGYFVRSFTRDVKHDGDRDQQKFLHLSDEPTRLRTVLFEKGNRSKPRSAKRDLDIFTKVRAIIELKHAVVGTNRPMPRSCRCLIGQYEIWKPAVAGLGLLPKPTQLENCTKSSFGRSLMCVCGCSTGIPAAMATLEARQVVRSESAMKALTKCNQPTNQSNGDGSTLIHLQCDCVLLRGVDRNRLQSTHIYHQSMSLCVYVFQTSLFDGYKDHHTWNETLSPVRTDSILCRLGCQLRATAMATISPASLNGAATILIGVRRRYRSYHCKSPVDGQTLSRGGLRPFAQQEAGKPESAEGPGGRKRFVSSRRKPGRTSITDVVN